MLHVPGQALVFSYQIKGALIWQLYNTGVQPTLNIPITLIRPLHITAALESDKNNLSQCSQQLRC